MTGDFRVLRHGQPVFYDFWAIDIESNRPVMKLKHFNADLIAWEEKNINTRMPVGAAAENDVTFAEEDGGVSLHYRITGNNLTCTVHHVKEGKGNAEVFVLTRAARD